MMIGTCVVKNGKIITSKTTYVVTDDTRPDVRRILFMPGMVIASGLSLLSIGFCDLLYTHEFILLGGGIFSALIAGVQVARLTILDRVTRGTQQVSAIYGLHTTLQNVRGKINIEIDEIKDSSKTKHPKTADLYGDMS